MALKTKNNLPITGRVVSFSEVKCGELFAFQDCDDGGVWCKTPMADMYEHMNQPTHDGGGFCTAICVNSNRINMNDYIQCNPNAVCIILDAKEILGLRIENL